MRLVLAALAAAALMVPMDAFAQRQPGQDGQRGQRDGQRDGQRGPGGFQGRGGFGGFGAPNPVMQALDTDKDGTLSAAEISAATANLKKLDKNNDGKIDQEELRPDFVASRIEALDTNKDKKLSKEEVANDRRMNESFAEIDKNKDGSLDEKEVRDYYAEIFRNFGGGRRPGGEGDRRPGDGNRRPGGDNNRPARPESNNNDVEL